MSALRAGQRRSDHGAAEPRRPGRVTDCFTLRSGGDLTEDTTAGRGELLRSVVVLEGDVSLAVELGFPGDPTAEPSGDGLRIRLVGWEDLDLRLVATVPLEGLRSTPSWSGHFNG